MARKRVSSKPQSTLDLVEEGKELIEGAKKITAIIHIDEDESATFTELVDKDRLNKAMDIANMYQKWGEKHRSSAAAEEAKELRDIAFYIKEAVRNARKDQELGSVASSSAAPKGKVKKVAKAPKIKKVKVPKKPVLTPEQEAVAARRREIKDMYRTRGELRRTALNKSSLPTEIRDSQGRYNRDYLLSNKNGDSAVARVVRDKITGQFKSVPGALIAYKRGGIVGKIFK